MFGLCSFWHSALVLLKPGAIISVQQTWLVWNEIQFQFPFVLWPQHTCKPFSISTKISMEQVIFLNKCTSFKLLITNRHVKAAYLSPILQTVAMVWFFPTLILLITSADHNSFLFGIVHHSSIICCWLKQCLNSSIYNFFKLAFVFFLHFQFAPD